MLSIPCLHSVLSRVRNHELQSNLPCSLQVCGDLLLTYPLVFASGREIVERLVLQRPDPQTAGPAEAAAAVGGSEPPQSSQEALEGAQVDGGQGEGLFVGGDQASVRAVLVGLTLLASQSGSFGFITNLVRTRPKPRPWAPRLRRQPNFLEVEAVAYCNRRLHHHQKPKP
jgi:hypothetical protein